MVKANLKETIRKWRSGELQSRNPEEKVKQIFANISVVNYQKLKDKFPAVNIDEIIEKKVKYYRIKPFKERIKIIWIDQIKEYLELINEDVPEESEKETKPIKESVKSLLDFREIVSNFFEQQPIYYDPSRLWWIWNLQEKKWERKDETDLMNMFDELFDIYSISQKTKGDIIEAMRRIGRKNKPKPIKKTWIQFQNEIWDIKTGEKFLATPAYFVTNPIPYKVSGNPQTPVIERIFKEWVGEKYVRTLFEVIAYCLLPDYPINRVFCFIGGGMNGKTCFFRLIEKFIGKSNITSTELDTLLSSRFEITRLHKKLVVIMGETNFSEMSKTSIIKKLTGGDLIGFEYKRADLFEDSNYAKILIATNNLPTTTDKTIGFFRRWCIIDFPNLFSEKKDILSDIPEEEYSNLATECVCVLKDLLEKREFTNEGTIEERMKRYEEHSDPLEKFLKEFTEEDADNKIWKFEFEKKLNEWCKENRFRTMSEVAIGKKMKEKGISQGLVYSDWLIDGKQKQLRAWLGLKWKEETR